MSFDVHPNKFPNSSLMIWICPQPQKKKKNNTCRPTPWAEQPRKHLGRQAHQKARGEVAGLDRFLSFSPKHPSREPWVGREVRIVLGTQYFSHCSLNSICAETFFIVRDIAEWLAPWFLPSKCQQSSLWCPSYCDNEEQPSCRLAELLSHEQRREGKHRNLSPDFSPPK